MQCNKDNSSYLIRVIKGRLNYWLVILTHTRLEQKIVNDQTNREAGNVGLHSRKGRIIT